MSVQEVKWLNYPDVLGVEWVNLYPDFPNTRYEHSLVWGKHGSTVQYCTRVVPSPHGGDPRWTTTNIVNPERLGFDGTKKGFEKLAEEFLKEEEPSAY